METQVISENAQIEHLNGMLRDAHRTAAKQLAEVKTLRVQVKALLRSNEQLVVRLAEQSERHAQLVGLMGGMAPSLS